MLSLSVGKIVLGEWCGKVTVTGGRGVLPCRVLAAAFIVIIIHFLLGNLYLRNIACKQLSAPKMGDIYFLLIEWDTKRIVLLH